MADENEESDWHIDDQACYHRDENFDTTPQDSEQQVFYSEVPDEASHEDIDINFITTSTEVRYNYKRCNNSFVSRNALFSHLRDDY